MAQPRVAAEDAPAAAVGGRALGGILLMRLSTLLGGAAAAAVLLGYLRTLGWSLWIDEAVSAWASRLPLSAYASSFSSGHSIGVYNMVLYYLLLKPWTALFGSSELALRSFSFVCFLTAALLLYQLARRWGRPIAVATLIVFLANPFLADRATDARAYALALLLAIASSEFLLRLLEQPRRRLWLAYGILAAALVYADAFGYLLLLAHTAAYLHLRSGRAARASMVACLVAVSLVVAPLLYLIVRANHAGRNSFGGLTWIPPLTPHSLFLVLAEVAGNSIPALVLAVAAAGFLALRRELPRMLRLPALYALALPIVLLALASLDRPVFVSRYLVICSPALALATGSLLASVLRAPAQPAAVAVLALTAVTLLVAASAPPALRVRQDWRGAAAYLHGSQAARGAVVVVPHYAWVAYAQYDGWSAPPTLAAALGGGATDIWVLARSYSVDTPAALAGARQALRGFVKVRTRWFGGLQAQEWHRRSSFSPSLADTAANVPIMAQEKVR